MSKTGRTRRTSATLRAGMVLLVGVSVFGVARADEAECRRPPDLSERQPVSPARLGAGADRVHFVKDGVAGKGCPAPGEACRERAFLVPGDRVLLTVRQGDFSCAHFVGGKAGLRTGWLPTAALSVEDAPPVAAGDWLGTWVQPEGEIRITAADRPGQLVIAGDATWGTGDPARVKRGGIHTGEISAKVAPAGPALSFAVGDDATLPVEKGGENTCKIWMHRVGLWLVVDDNNACGGANVSFKGVYARKP